MTFKPNILTKTLLIFCLALALMAAGVYALISTTTGTRWLLTTARSLVPGELKYTGLSGQINRQLTLTGLNYQYQGFKININHLQLDWQPAALFHGTLTLNNLQAQQIDITLPQLTDEEEPLRALNLPLQFNIQNLDLQQITLHTAQSPQRAYLIDALHATVNTQGEHLIWQSQIQALGSNTSFNGNLSMQPLLSWQIQIKSQALNLGKLWANWQTHLQLQLDSDGSVDQYAVRLTQLSGTLNQQTLNANGFIQINQQQLTGLNAQLSAGQAQIKISGTAANQNVNFSWNINIPSLSPFLSGLTGKIVSQGDIQGNRSAPHIRGVFLAQNINFAPYQLTQLQAKADLNLAQNQAAATLQAKHLQLGDYLIQTLNLNSNGSGKQQRSQLQLSLLAPAQTRALTITADNQTQISANDLNSTTQITLPQQPPLQINLKLPQFSWHNLQTRRQALQAQLNWQTNRLDFLALLSPQLQKPSGQVALNLTASGSLSEPQISGQFTLKQGQVFLNDPHIHVSNMTANIQGERQQIRYQASAHFGQQILTLMGNTQLQTQPVTTQFTLKGQSLLVSNSPEFKLYVSPDFDIKLSGSKIVVTGNLTIPQAAIQPTDFSNTETLPDELVYVNQAGEPVEPKDHWNLNSTIHVTLGDQVTLNAKGLNGQVGGALTITQLPHKPATANGQLTLKNGTYNAYGTKLTIEQGQLNYTGNPVNNPGLNVQAIRTLKTSGAGTFTVRQQDLVVGIDIQGTLNQPKVNLFSRPTGFSQADILSYLILGQPASAAGKDKQSQGQLLLAAAEALNVGGGTGNNIAQLTNEVKSSLGLSELGLESETTLDSDSQRANQTTSLVLGKYLSPRLYISYSIGLFDPASVFRTRYSLSKRWAIQTESQGDGTGVDLLYSFERK